MTLVVADVAVVMDLDRAGLLERACRLDRALMITDALCRRGFPGEATQRLLAMGLTMAELSSAEAAAATGFFRTEPSLCLPSAFGLALALSRGWSILSAEGCLRSRAEAFGLEAVDPLWIVDRLDASGGCDRFLLHQGLTAALHHPGCRLPRAEVERRLKRYSAGFGPH